jgi:hypothetical protein
MDLSFQVDASGFPAYTANKLDQLYAALTVKLDNLNAELQRRVVENLQGNILQQRTGKAARSVEAIPAARSGDIIEGGVQAGGGPAFYLKFQEEGTSGPYVIEAKGKALAFMMDGTLRFFKRVMHPGLTAKRPVGLAFDSMRDEILAGLQAVPGEVAARTKEPAL